MKDKCEQHQCVLDHDDDSQTDQNVGYGVPRSLHILIHGVIRGVIARILTGFLYYSGIHHHAILMSSIRNKIHFTLPIIRQFDSFLMARLHRALASTLLPLCDDASDTILIENNGVAPQWDCNPFFQ